MSSTCTTLQGIILLFPFSALRPVPVTSDQELGVIKSRIAELKAQLNRDNKEKERKGNTLDKDASFVRDINGLLHHNVLSLLIRNETSNLLEQNQRNFVRSYRNNKCLIG